jgi:hypothetical protein
MAGRSSLRTSRRRAISDINVVPYIDVMLVLLVIFMVTAPLVNPGVVNLPTVGGAKVQALPPIFLTIGADEVIIDRVDYELVSPHRWCKGAHGYIKCNVDYEPIYLHRLLVGGDSAQIDHINHNHLDNRRANLRAASHTENFGNRLKHRTYGGKPTSSIYKGVYYKKQHSINENPWRASIAKNKTKYDLDAFETEEEAARAYNKAAKKIYGEFARINKIEGEE